MDNLGLSVMRKRVGVLLKENTHVGGQWRFRGERFFWLFIHSVLATCQMAECQFIRKRRD